MREGSVSRKRGDVDRFGDQSLGHEPVSRATFVEAMQLPDSEPDKYRGADDS